MVPFAFSSWLRLGFVLASSLSSCRESLKGRCSLFVLVLSGSQGFFPFQLFKFLSYTLKHHILLSWKYNGKNNGGGLPFLRFLLRVTSGTPPRMYQVVNTKKTRTRSNTHKLKKPRACKTHCWTDKNLYKYKFLPKGVEATRYNSRVVGPFPLPQLVPQLVRTVESARCGNEKKASDAFGL